MRGETGQEDGDAALSEPSRQNRLCGSVEKARIPCGHDETGDAGEQSNDWGVDSGKA